LEPGRAYSAELDAGGRQNRMTARGLGGNIKKSSRKAPGGTGRRTAEFRFATPEDLGGTHGLWIGNRRQEERIGVLLDQGRPALPMDVDPRNGRGRPFTIHLQGGAGPRPQTSTTCLRNNYTGYVCGLSKAAGRCGDILRANRGARGQCTYIDSLSRHLPKSAEDAAEQFPHPAAHLRGRDNPGEIWPAFHFAFDSDGGHSARRADQS